MQLPVALLVAVAAVAVAAVAVVHLLVAEQMHLLVALLVAMAEQTQRPVALPVAVAAVVGVLQQVAVGKLLRAEVPGAQRNQ